MRVLLAELDELLGYKSSLDDDVQGWSSFGETKEVYINNINMRKK